MRTLGTIQRTSGFFPLPQDPAGNGANDVQFALQFFGGSSWSRFLFDLPAGAQKQIRFGKNTFPYRDRSFPPCRIEHFHFPGGKLIPYHRFGHTFAIPPLGARHRHQILHGRLRSDVSVTNFLLNRFGQFPHKCQTARYPGSTAIETQGKIVQAEIETAMQLLKQPALLQGSFPFGRTKRTVQNQSFRFIHVPDRGPHGIAPQAFQRPDPFVAVNDDKSVGFPEEGNHHDGYLLTPFGK